MPNGTFKDYVNTEYSFGGSPTLDPSEPPLDPSYFQFTLESYREADGPVPSYRRKIATGDNATSNLVGVKRKLEIHPGHFALSYSPYGIDPIYYWSQARGDLCYSYVEPEGFMDGTDATNQAKMKFHNKCLAVLGSLEGQVFLGELAETLHMIKNPARALRSSFDDYFQLLRGRRKGTKAQRLRVVSESWLEFNFGVRPLINDIENGWSALERFASRPIRFKPVKATGVATDMLDLQYLDPFYGSVHQLVQSITSQSTAVTYMGIVDLATGGRERLQSELGFRFDRFVPSLYELIPYSFVVDYFSNLGDIISSWAFGTKHLRWSSSSTRVEFKTERSTLAPTVEMSPLGAYAWVRREPARSRGTFVRVARSLESGSLVPSFRLEIPGMASTKWLNLAALSRTRNSLRPY